MWIQLLRGRPTDGYRAHGGDARVKRDHVVVVRGAIHAMLAPTPHQPWCGCDNRDVVCVDRRRSARCLVAVEQSVLSGDLLLGVGQLV